MLLSARMPRRMVGRENQVSSDIQKYFDANPQVQADLEGIRQPLIDLKDRCAAT